MNEKSRAILARMQEDMRRAVLEEMRPAHDLAALAGRGAEEMRSDLERWKAERRIFSVAHDGAEYFPLFALDPADGYRPYPAVAAAMRILSEIMDGRDGWGLGSWFVGVNGYLDAQRPEDLLASDPEWVIEAAKDEINSVKYPHG